MLVYIYCYKKINFNGVVIYMKNKKKNFKKKKQIISQIKVF